MQPSAPLACWQCGTVLSAPGGRCPACGVEQANPPVSRAGLATATTTAPRYHGGLPIDPQKSKAVPWIILGVGLAVIALVGFLFAPRGDKEAPPAAKAETPTPAALPAPSAAPGELGIEDTRAVDPTDVLARARARAIAWHPDAILVSMRAEPVVGKGVDLNAGGALEYRFGRSAGQGFGAGAKLSNQRLTIAVTRDGEKVTEGTATDGRAAIDPNCPFAEALRKVRASGVGPDLPLTIVYEFSPNHDRTVFRVSAPGNDGLTRSLDGQSCAILVR